MFFIVEEVDIFNITLPEQSQIIKILIRYIHFISLFD